jgi:hypothetical protein
MSVLCQPLPEALEDRTHRENILYGIWFPKGLGTKEGYLMLLSHPSLFSPFQWAE